MGTTSMLQKPIIRTPALETPPAEFRAALSQLTSGVSLVTAHDPDGEDLGMTATSLVSISLSPPLVLISLRNGSRMQELLARIGTWAVSLLGEEHRALAACFATSGRLSDRALFADMQFRRGHWSRAPLVDHALSIIECRTENQMVAGDHTIVIGQVLEARVSEGTAPPPLLYLRGEYRTLP
ncbi:flavin reductase family protein [Kribbella sp. NBC_00359]|uniref:flavin reductase family protein n=1 Tax=Kribbella sp. NBC_00359 TaxID=2975966 RepID=UPI003FA56CE6